MLMTLARVPVGKTAQVFNVLDENSSRLATLGFRPGVRVSIIAKTAGPGIIVRVGDARICVSNKVAAQVLVDARQDTQAQTAENNAHG